MWAPYPCQGLSYLEMDGLENDHSKVFSAGTRFLFLFLFFFMHFHKYLFSCTHYLKWFYDAILRGSPHLLGNSFEVPCDMHTARPPAHTLVLGLSRQPAAAIWWEIISCQEKACVWFDPSVQVTGVELKSPPFCSALAWSLVSCTVGLTVSWTRDILSPGMDPMDLPGPDSRLFCGYNIELIHCFWL